nr:pentatricopeptide repeat-containing protein At3g24000, mitochondrial-like [Ipomoea batatas]
MSATSLFSTPPIHPPSKSSKSSLSPSPERLKFLIDKSKTIKQLLQIHVFLIRHGVDCDPILNFRLQRSYSSLGHLKHSAALFRSTPSPSVFTYTTAQMFSSPRFSRWAIQTLYPTIKTSLIKCLNKPQLKPKHHFPSIGFYSCSYDTLPTVERETMPNSSKFHASFGFQTLPRKLRAADIEGVPLGILVKQGAQGITKVGKSRKRDLKRYSEMFRDYTQTKNLKEGKVLHGELVRNLIDPDMHLYVSLINFYAKSGDLSSARKVFDQMSERDVVSWTSLISGFLPEGNGSESVRLFCEMKREGVKPNGFTLATVLKGCSLCLNLEFGKQLHAEVVKSDTFSDVYIGSALIDLYAKCRQMEDAKTIFLHMSEQNLVSWNALLNGYAQEGEWQEVLRLFCSLSESEFRFSNYTLSTVLKSCANVGNLRVGQVLHSMAIKIGSELDNYISSSLVDMYSKFRLPEDSMKVFKRIRSPDVVAWSTMINGLDQQGHKKEAFQLFQLMRHSDVRPNQFTLASVVSAAADLGDLLFCKSIHACVFKFGVDSENVVSNTLISMYMNFGSFNDGYKVFVSMDSRDVISWNGLLSGFYDNETSHEGPKIFRQMLIEGFKPNMYTFISILRACSSLSNVSLGKQVHAHVVKENLSCDCYVGTTLIDMYSKCGCLNDVEVIFNRLTQKDVFTWTVMTAGYAQSDQGEKAFECLSQMLKEGVKPNEFTLASCVNGASRMASLSNGRQLHCLAVKSGQFSDLFVASALADMYGKCGCVADAETLFEGMDSCDTVLWNTMICSYSQHGHGKKALQAFRMMLNEGTLPDAITFIGVLSACSHMGLVDEGRRYFESINNTYGIIPSIEHYACMVDILGRAGKFDEMKNFIEHMELTSNALIWETVLGACTIHGNIELAEKAAKFLFEFEPKVESSYILLSNIYAAKGMWNDVAKLRAFMSDQGIKKEPGCSWVEVNAQIHVFLCQDASHPRLNDIHKKLDELYLQLNSAGYIPNTGYSLRNVTDQEKRANLLHHSERLALAFALLNDNTNNTIRIFKNLRICGDCHEFMKLLSGITHREIVIRDVTHFHHFCDGTCSCNDYW